MFEKGKSTPEQREQIEKGFPVSIWFVAILAVLAIGIIFGPSLMTGTVSSSSGGESVDIPTGDGLKAKANVSEETESNTIEIVSTDLKLLKKIGPFTLPPYEEKVNGVLVVQSESFSLDESGSYIVGITSTRDPGITFKAKCYPPKKIIILMILKDEKENPIAGSKIDTETGIYYVSRGVANPDMTAGSPLSVEKVPSSSFSGQQAKTWEVLVYG